MLGRLEGQQPSPAGPSVTALMAARASKGNVLSDFREVLPPHLLPHSHTQCL